MWNQFPLPTAEEEWTRSDQAAMDLCKTMNIHVSETTLGEEHSKAADMLVAGIATGVVPRKSLDMLQNAIDQHPKDANESTNHG